MKSEVPAQWLGPRPRERLLWGGGMLLLSCVFVILISYFYVRAEHYFYSWDWANYQNMASAETAAFRASPVWAVHAVMSTLAEDYNRIFTVPLVPILAVFGDSRVVFITSMTLVYLLPFALVLGAIATKLIPLPPRKVFWSTALLTLLIPTIWAPTLRGWPDVGAAFLIALALWVHLEDRLLSRTVRILLIGFLAVAAMLFRRQYAYDAVALYGALGLQALALFAVELKKNAAVAFRQLFDNIVYIGLAGVVSLFTLVLIGWPFLFHVLGHDYLALYSSYEQPLHLVVHDYLMNYGWGVCVLAVVGFAAGLAARVLSFAPAVLLLFFGGISFLEWVLVVRQGGFHYTLHFAAVVVLGTASLGWVIWSQCARRTRVALLGAMGLFLLLNFVNGLAPARWITNGRLQPVFAINYPPLVRKDYDAVARLIAYLRKATRSEPTYIVASNLVLNPDLVKNAERALYGYGKTSLQIVKSPEIDSRDFYPLEPLLKSDYVVLATPFQHHMPVKDQRVVESVYDAFVGNWAISKDFVRLPAQFPLENGVVVNIYRRTRDTSPATALQTLLRIQSLVGQRPGGQAAWLMLGQFPQSTVRQTGDHAYSVETLLFGGRDSDTTSFAYVEAPPEQARVAGKLIFRDDRCKGVKLHLATINRQGALTDVADGVLHPGDATEFDFSSFSTQQAEDLLLSISSANQGDPNSYCELRIDHLKVAGE